MDDNATLETVQTELDQESKQTEDIVLTDESDKSQTNTLESNKLGLQINNCSKNGIVGKYNEEDIHKTDFRGEDQTYIKTMKTSTSGNMESKGQVLEVPSTIGKNENKSRPTEKYKTEEKSDRNGIEGKTELGKLDLDWSPNIWFLLVLLLILCKGGWQITIWMVFINILALVAIWIYNTDIMDLFTTIKCRIVGWLKQTNIWYKQRKEINDLEYKDINSVENNETNASSNLVTNDLGIDAPLEEDKFDLPENLTTTETDNEVYLSEDDPRIFTKISNTISARVGDRHVEALIDTGATISLLKQEVYETERCLQNLAVDYTKSKRAVTADGSPLPLLGTIRIPIKIADTEIEHEVFIAKNLTHDLVLGLDFLNEHKAQLEFDEGHLQLLGSEPVPLQKKYYLNREVKLTATSTIKVEPRSHKVLIAKLNTDETFSEREGIIVPNPRLAGRTHIMGAHALVKVEDQKVPFMFYNPTDKPITVYRCTNLGYIEFDPVEVVANLSTDAKYEEIEEFVQTMTLDGNKVKKADSPNVDLSESVLNNEQKFKVEELLLKYRHVFANTDSELGRTSAIKHKIDTGDNPPCRARPYRVGPVQRKIIEEKIDEMLEQGIISESNSEYASPIVLVKKSDSSWRFCIDFRALNKITRRDSYSIPRIDDTLDALGTSQPKFFSTLDLRSGYWQVELDGHESKAKTAFISHRGLHEFNVMPFGLHNAPATFQRLMESVLRNMNWKFLLVYIDDIVIFSNSFEQHLEHLEQVLKTLGEANLTLKPTKCKLFRDQLVFLGFKVSEKGISVDEDKTKAILEFPVPRNLKQLRSYLGVTGFYRKFIKDYAKIANPLHKLLRKDVKFEWGKEQQNAFDKLKEKLTNPPILNFPDFSKQFILCCDCSNTALGIVLAQEKDGKECVIAYGGRDLTPAEQVYSTTEKEALSVICAIKKWRLYLLGQKFKVITDHSAVRYIMNIKDPIGRLARWIMFLQQYDMEIIHRPGRAHNNADGLSRREWGTTVLQIDDGNDSQLQELARKQRDDHELRDIISYLEYKTLPSDDKLARRIMLISEAYHLNYARVLYRILPKLQGGDGEDDLLRLVIPKDMRSDIIVAAHDHVLAAHYGVAKTYQKIKSRYYWVGMFADIEHWVRSCPSCNTRKTPKTNRKASLQPIPPAEQPFERVSIDCVGPITRSKRGNRYIVVLTDYLTRWPEAFAVRSIKAKVIADLLFKQIVCRHGTMKMLLSDRGTNFLSKVVTELCKLLDTEQHKTSSYRPQCNGLTEKFNGTLIQGISMYVDSNQLTWDDFIEPVLFSYRSTPCKSTGYSPFYLLYGRMPRLPLDMALLGDEDSDTDPQKHLEIITEKLKGAQTKSIENLRKAQDQMKASYDKKAKQRRFQVGDEVWMYNPAHRRHLSRKLQHLWKGPFKIAKLVPGTECTYRLKTMQGRMLSAPVHSDRLKKYVDPNERLIRRTQLAEQDNNNTDLNNQSDLGQTMHQLDNGNTDDVLLSTSTSTSTNREKKKRSKRKLRVYQIEKIVGHRLYKGQKQYCVKWTNYPSNRNSWVIPDNIFDKDKIKQYEDENNTD
jgi:predicted aspartyl protease